MPAIINPATGEPVAERVEHGTRELSAAMEQARGVQPSWGATAVADRARVVRRVQKWIVAHADEIARLVSDCTGKPRVDALSTEVLPSAILCNYYARNAKRFLAPQRLAASSVLFVNKRSTLFREPFGVVAIISPWNYPLGIPMHEVVTGLLSGNAVLLKVATQTQPVGDLIGRMFEESGLPEGLLHILHIPGRLAGDPLLGSGIGKLFFTGSTEVGRRLAEKAAPRLIPVSLELGGNDPMIVLPDADLERAAACAVWAGVSNTGQSCGAVERIYVHERVYARFLEILRPKVASLRAGYDRDQRVDFGPLTTQAQLDTVRSHLDEALSGDGREVARSASGDTAPDVTADGADSADRSSGLFHPAVLVEVSGDTGALVRDETFGPLLAVRKVSSDTEAVELANDSRYGLTASVWTRDRRKARELAGRLQAASITVNDHLMSHGMPETPWGGFKESGIGRSHSRIGFEEMTQPKVVVEERFRWIRRNMWWHPYSPEVYDGLKGALLGRYGGGTAGRVGGLVRAVRLFIRRARGA